jgi:hypothetical protein
MFGGSSLRPGRLRTPRTPPVRRVPRGSFPPPPPRAPRTRATLCRETTGAGYVGWRARPARARRMLPSLFLAGYRIGPTWFLKGGSGQARRSHGPCRGVAAAYSPLPTVARLTSPTTSKGLRTLLAAFSITCDGGIFAGRGALHGSGGQCAQNPHRRPNRVVHRCATRNVKQIPVFR